MTSPDSDPTSEQGEDAAIRAREKRVSEQIPSALKPGPPEDGTATEASVDANH